MALIGSNEAHGSSIKKTSGSTASALAIHSRCWPPESSSAWTVQVIFNFLPKGSFTQAGFYPFLKDLAACQTVQAQAASHVFKNRKM